MTIRYLLQKEFLQIRRNSFMPKIILAFPIIIMCVMPWVMNQEVKGIRVAVVDYDRSTRSQEFVHSIQASGYFLFSGLKNSYSEALREVERSKVDVIVEIPPGYSRDITLGLQPQILIAANAVNGTKGNIGATYLSRILISGNRDADLALREPEVLSLYNKGQSYKVFMIPALMGILMMMLCGFLPALNIVGEKEAGTIEQINVTPVSKWAFILAKLIPYWLIGMLVLTVCLILSWAIYGITCQGPIALIYLLAVLLALFFSSLGLIVSNYSDTMRQAMMVMWFFVMILMLLSGLFTPTRSMPNWAYQSTYINPMHYFIDAIRTVFIRGGGLREIVHQLLALTAIASVMGVWAVLSYRKNN